MYQGFNKDNGGIIGNLSNGIRAEFSDVQESSSAEESIICHDEYGNEIILQAALDPQTGDLSWLISNDKDNILKRTVGMSQMTSMLRDNDRNSVYSKAISLIIKDFKDKYDRFPIILDIGAGTGLLSLLSVSHGAERVVAIEMFEAMSDIASKIVDSNNLNDKIFVLCGKSTDIDDLPIKPDVLVSELLDSALLGESCIPSTADAIYKFISAEPDEIKNRVIPNSAKVYASLVESEEIVRMQNVTSIGDNLHFDFNPYRNSFADRCQGGWSLIPIDWNKFESRGSKILSDVSEIINFDFFHAHNFSEDQENLDINIDSERENYSFGEGTHEVCVKILKDGCIHAILLWWDLFLLSPDIDPDQEVKYSTKPGAQNWQDHWKQTIFPLPLGQNFNVKAGEQIKIRASNDMVKIWLVIEKVEQPSSPNSLVPENKKTKFSFDTSSNNETSLFPANADFRHKVEFQECACGWHLLFGSDRFQMINDKLRQSNWASCLDSLFEKIITDYISINYSETNKADNLCDKYILDLGDGSLLPIYLARKLKDWYENKKNSTTESNKAFNKLRIVSRETKFFSKLFFSQLCEANQLDDYLFVWDGEDLQDITDYFDNVDEENELNEKCSSQDMIDSESQGVDAIEVDNGMDRTRLFSEKSIVAMVCECFFYQLSSLPTWEALKYFYMRNPWTKYLHPECVFVPEKAIVKVAAIQVESIFNSFGPVSEVMGFDHSAYDEMQATWFTHKFPYKIQNYDYILLSEPTIMATIDYQNNLISLIDENFEIPILKDGIFHGLVIWVDLDLNGSDSIKQYTGSFPPYSTVNLKFQSSGEYVKMEKNKMKLKVVFELGDSDFDVFPTLQ